MHPLKGGIDMLRKSFVPMLLSLLFVFSFGFTVQANGVSEIKNDLNELINEQLNIVSDFNESLSIRRGVFNSINLIAPIDAEGVLFVSLDDNSDETLKEEILSLPGIDSELIRFVNFEIAWHGPRESRSMEEESDLEIINLLDPRTIGREIRMGSVVTIWGHDWTVGPPLADNRTSYTANHGALLNNDAVIRPGTRETMGIVDRWVIGSFGDASRVNMIPWGHWVSHTLTSISGNMPAPGSWVTSRTGFSGNISGTIFANGARVPGFDDPFGRPVTLDDMTIVWMQSQKGDSGAALIAGNTAVGVMSFGGYIDGRPVVLFTPIRNIPF